MVGRVVSTKLKNTATVLVERVAIHPLYKKTYIQTKKYLADTQEEVKDGDIVEIIPCKPVSKRKAFRVIKILGRSLAEIAEEVMKEKAEEAIAQVMPEEKVESRVESQEAGEEIKQDVKVKSDKSKTRERKGKTSS